MKVWTEMEIQFLRDFYATDGAEYVARYLGRSVSAVQTKACRLHLADGNPPAWDDDEDAILAGRYPLGGIDACKRLLPRRSRKAIVQRVSKLAIRRVA